MAESQKLKVVDNVIEVDLRPADIEQVLSKIKCDTDASNLRDFFVIVQDDEGDIHYHSSGSLKLHTLIFLLERIKLSALNGELNV